LFLLHFWNGLVTKIFNGRGLQIHKPVRTALLLQSGDQQQQQQKEWQHMDICPEERKPLERKWVFPDKASPAKNRFAWLTGVSKLSIE